jgi:hypothetical protein
MMWAVGRGLVGLVIELRISFAPSFDFPWIPLSQLTDLPFPDLAFARVFALIRIISAKFTIGFNRNEFHPMNPVSRVDCILLKSMCSTDVHSKFERCKIHVISLPFSEALCNVSENHDTFFPRVF